MDEFGLKAKVKGHYPGRRLQGIPGQSVIILPLALTAFARLPQGQTSHFF
jgi:hypothetical protein